jgi:hypothetical protein
MSEHHSRRGINDRASPNSQERLYFALFIALVSLARGILAQENGLHFDV